MNIFNKLKNNDYELNTILSISFTIIKADEIHSNELYELIERNGSEITLTKYSEDDDDNDNEKEIIITSQDESESIEYFDGENSNEITINSIGGDSHDDKQQVIIEDDYDAADVQYLGVKKVVKHTSNFIRPSESVAINSIIESLSYDIGNAYQVEQAEKQARILYNLYILPPTDEELYKPMITPISNNLFTEQIIKPIVIDQKSEI